MQHCYIVSGRGAATPRSYAKDDENTGYWHIFGDVYKVNERVYPETARINRGREHAGACHSRYSSPSPDPLEYNRNMPPDLPESYYLDNVLTLFEHVERVYADLLEPDQAAFLMQFGRLGDDAKKLYIRLLNRSHDWFRRGKLNYGEIGSIDAAIDELASCDCLAVNADIDKAMLISLFTRPELLGFFKVKTGLNKLKRTQLETLILERDDDEFFDRLKSQDDLLQVLQQDEYQICQMLFFGNFNQSMTDFVLRDLGLYQFESYRIDPAHRPYRSRVEIQQHWSLQQLESGIELSATSDTALLLAYFDMIPTDIARDAPAFSKSDRLGYEIARQLERSGDLHQAIELYRRCFLPPSRERIARIYAQQGKPRQALDACTQIIEQPVSEAEIQFACMFATRLIKKHNFASVDLVEEHRIVHQPEVVELELNFHDPVEMAVADYYGNENCYYLENSLFNGVLGLLIWEVVFAPLDGAFFNPFQYRPSDFYAFDFVDKRRQLFDQVWSSINTTEDIREKVNSCWSLKQDLMNPLVNWQDLSLDIIELALERIEFSHWRAVFDRILLDLRNNRAGFPDLVHFPAEGGYCLIEVKGPGDSLQKNQQRWMQYFHQQGIPHRLTRVTWKQG